MHKNPAKQPVLKLKINIGVEIYNYQWKVFLLNIFQIQLILVEMKKIWMSLIYKWWQWTSCTWFTFSYVSSIIIFKSGILLYGMSTVWENTDGCAKQYMCTLDIYLITVLSSSYVIIMDRVINAPCHGKMLLMDSMQQKNVIRSKKWNLLVN